MNFRAIDRLRGEQSSSPRSEVSRRAEAAAIEQRRMFGEDIPRQVGRQLDQLYPFGYRGGEE